MTTSRWRFDEDMDGYSRACRKGVVSADSGRGRFIRAHGKAAFVRQDVSSPGSSGTWSAQSVLCRAEIPSRTEIEGFLSLFFAGWVFAICCGCIWKRTQTAQTRLTAQQRVALAYGELLPQPRLSVASSLYQKRPQSGCGSSPPSGGSDWAQQPKAASVQSVFFFQIRSKLNQSLPFLSLSTSNTIIREERADKKSPCSL